MSDSSRADRLKHFVGLDQARLIRTTIDARTQSLLKHTGDALVLELSGTTQRLSQPYADLDQSPADIRSWDLDPLGHYTEFFELTIGAVGEDGVAGEAITARCCLVPSLLLDVLDFEGADQAIRSARDTDGIGEGTKLNVSIRFSQMDTEARLLLAELSADKRSSPPMDSEGLMTLEATHTESDEHPLSTSSPYLSEEWIVSHSIPTLLVDGEEFAWSNPEPMGLGVRIRAEVVPTEGSVEEELVYSQLTDTSDLTAAIAHWCIPL
ncbi:hypothetical protein JCM24511_07117 [Saitozyma sp. JCM 24511]|nr:hypothetical protein JCM24511_07117 [Saitozyma sp. JCM 24511]